MTVAYVGSVYLDGNSGTFHNISDFAIYPYYNSHTNANDIALIKLEDKISLGGNVQPINFPIDITVSTGDNATIVGWGAISVRL